MDQDLALQREVLESAGVNTVFEEKASGIKRDGRTELQKAFSVLGEGNALVVNAPGSAGALDPRPRQYCPRDRAGRDPPQSHRAEGRHVDSYRTRLLWHAGGFCCL
jgi:hypothetical protein